MGALIERRHSLTFNERALEQPGGTRLLVPPIDDNPKPLEQKGAKRIDDWVYGVKDGIVWGHPR